MKIVIAGAGKVGFELARSLSNENDVTVIDKNAEALERLSELIDVYTIAGDIENPRTYRSLLDTRVDVFVAVTDSDEANIISILLAGDVISIGRKIIRLRNSYFEESNFLASLGDLERIFPYRMTAETVRLLLRYPEANNVKHFRNTSTKLISIQVDNPLYEIKKVELFETDRLKIVAIERDKEFIIPDPDLVVRHGDRLYFLGDGELLGVLYGQLDLHMPPKIENAVVFGADELGIEVTKVLIEEGVSVKILDKDIQRCHKAADIFQDDALVINSRYDEEILYKEENLDQSDIVVETDRKDEANIMRALAALENGVPKVVAVNNERKYYPLMHRLGMVVARGPQMSAYYAVLEQIGHDEAVEIKHFCGGKGIVISRYIKKGSDLAGIQIKSLDIPGLLTIERDGDLMKPSGLVLQEGDLIYVVIGSENEKRGIEWVRTLL